jgi:hypothetical protein
MVKMAKRFHVIAPDTLGNGDSVPPEQNQPEIVDYAHATLETIGVLGWFLPPASSNKTCKRPSAVRRLARTEPEDPAPTII